MGVEDPAKRDADVAQSAEHPPCKRAVIGSIPIVGSTGKRIDHFQKCQPIKTLYLGSYPSGQRGLTVNQLSEDFGGSNPSLPTTGKFPAARIAHIAQSVEHTLGKGEVTGPNPVVGSVAEKVLCLRKGERDMAKQ